MPQRDTWWEDAACQDADPDLFMPAHLRGANSSKRGNSYGRKQKPSEDKVFHDAKQVCAVCPVQPACLKEVLESDGEIIAYQGGFTPSSLEELRARYRKKVRR